MKPFKLFLLLTLFLITAIPKVYGANVLLDEKLINLNTPPVKKSGVIFVPLRGIFEKMGAIVVYNKEKNLIIAYRKKQNIRLTPGESYAQVNGFKKKMLQPAFTYKERLYVPLRFLSEALGCYVSWHPPTRTVSISTKKRQNPIDNENKKNKKSMRAKIYNNLLNLRKSKKKRKKKSIKPINSDIKDIKPIEKNDDDDEDKDDD